MEPDLQARLDQQDIILSKIQKDCQKTKNYMMWTFIGTIVVFVIPMIVMAFMLPSIIENMENLTLELINPANLPQ